MEWKYLLIKYIKKISDLFYRSFQASYVYIINSVAGWLLIVFFILMGCMGGLWDRRK